MRAQKRVAVRLLPAVRAANPRSAHGPRRAAWPLQRIALLAALALVQGCSTTHPMNHYDFGVPAPTAATAPADAPATTAANTHPADSDADIDIDVLAPSWLDTSAIVYRMDYADASQVHVYAQSQWAAPPARLLEQLLQQRRLAAAPCAAGLVRDPKVFGTRLRVELQEFSQTFSSPGSSAVVLRARARLMAPHSHAVLTQRDFDLRAAASPPDAAGAVHGLRDLSFAFTGAVLSWASGAFPASCNAPPPEPAPVH